MSGEHVLHALGDWDAKRNSYSSQSSYPLLIMIWGRSGRCSILSERIQTNTPNNILRPRPRYGQWSSYNNTVWPVDMQFKIPCFSENIYGNKIIRVTILTRLDRELNEAPIEVKTLVPAQSAPALKRPCL
ncbi:hypothetical protein TNCV_1404141 [Trichonephila clavipes]|nr:hypothetical protein TNCV_1404141 [Trichonephila clavipes]